MKYPVGIQDFAKIIEDGYVYVDKTDLLYSLTHEGTTFFLSRPRRFGKSLLVSTLEYYYQGRKDLFEGLAIADMEKEWAQHPVFHLDFNVGDYKQAGELERTIEDYLQSWEAAYGIEEKKATISLRFKTVLQQAHEQTGRRVVVLIDEYDKPILDVLDTDCHACGNGNEKTLLEERHRDILRAFYSTLKSVDRDLQFVLLTGVTKFSQVSVFSGFNQPNDISMTERYDALCGITEGEMASYFAKPIAELAAKMHKSEKEMREMLKGQYDGYHFSSGLRGVYNPFSILKCFNDMSIGAFWFSTGTPSYLIRLLSHNKRHMDEIAGRPYRAAEFIDYKASIERPLPMIYQSGYLTIKDYNPEMQTFLLDFPNNEVREGFLTMVANDYLRPGQEDVGSWLIYATDDLRRGNIVHFLENLTAFLADVPYTMRRKKGERERERYFHYTFYLLLRLLASYTVFTEKEQSKGRVDCIVETPRYIYVFEFKLDGTPEEALRQISERGYARPYATDPRKLYKVGVNFSSEEGTVEGFLVEE